MPSPVESLGHLLRRQAQRLGERPLLRFEGQELSFAAVERLTNRVAQLLTSKGVRRGDRVAVMLPNGLDFPLAWLSIAKVGAVMVPINVQYKVHDLGFALGDSGVELALADPSLVPAMEAVRSTAPALREVIGVPPGTLAGVGSGPLSEQLNRLPPDFALPDLSPDALLNIQYTSGTTGEPKGCMLTHEYWMLLGQRSWEFSRLVADDIALTAQPFYYMDPQWNVAMCLHGGIPLVILPRFSASTFWRSVKESGATFFYLLGTMPLFLLKQPPDPRVEREHRVKFIACSGIIPQLHGEYESRWGVPWREAYGTTESGVDLVVPIDDASCVGTGAMGVPVTGKEARVIDATGADVPDGEVGELIVRGKPMMLGYWNRPEATAEKIKNGWLHTGDLVVRDARGYYHIVGRLKDMIRRGGENISAAEVESVLAEHPSVRAAAVVPVPDELRGEEVKAFIQLQPNATQAPVLPETILGFVRERLAAFKVPRYVEYIDEFPRTPSERVEKHKLLALRVDQRVGAYDASVGAWR
jgi:crotonobetaine/carnitine-CoA ligase